MQFTNILLLSLPAALAEFHTVKVGENGQTFDPQVVQAAEGDTVIFELFPSHNVIQANGFNGPCTPKTDNGGGFFSGPFSETEEGTLRFVTNVTGEDPIWYYCGVQKHCQNGMVGGINVAESGDKTIDAFAEKAASVEQSETPEERRHGELMDEEQVEELMASPTTSASGTGGSPTPTTGSDEPTGAAKNLLARPEFIGVEALALGFAAWFL